MKKLILNSIIVSLGLLLAPVNGFAKEDYSFPSASGEKVIKSEDAKILQALSKSFAEISKKTRPSLVYIQTRIGNDAPRSLAERQLEDLFGGRPGLPRQRQGSGSGFIADKDNGYILTNNHVIQGATEIKVKTFDNQTIKAKVVGTSPSWDVAVIKVDAKKLKGLTEVRLGNSDTATVGTWVVALGAPFGLPQTMTSGIISAIGRTDIMSSGQSLESFIQTDAAINPGNSGGPLLNLDGEVIGINTAIYSKTGSFAGIGFAVPSNYVRFVAEQLINTGKVSRGFIGITMEPTTPEQLKEFGYAVNKGGVLVASVSPGGPAEKAGLKAGDLIVGVNGKPVLTFGALKTAIGSKLPGTKVKVDYYRGKKRKQTTVTLVEFPNSQSAAAGDDQKFTLESGLKLKPLTPSIRKSQKVKTKQKGAVYIEDVAQTRRKPRPSDLQAGDVILKINRQPVKGVGDVRARLSKAREKNQRVMIHVERDRRVVIAFFR